MPVAQTKSGSPGLKPHVMSVRQHRHLAPRFFERSDLLSSRPTRQKFETHMQVGEPPFQKSCNCAQPQQHFRMQ